MNKTELFNIMGNISDDLIVEAGDPIKKVKRIKISKALALAAAIITVFLGLTAFASSIMIKRRSVQSTNIPDYYTVPPQSTLQKDIGIAPYIPERFSTGYVFDSAVIAQNTDYGEDDSIFEEYKSVSCDYLRGSDKLHLNVDGAAAGIQMDESETAAIYKNSSIKYNAYANKCVPENYRLTEQDKKDEASGKYVFSFGSEEVEIHDVQILGFEYGGLSYTVCAIDSSVTKDELVQTAKEIIDCQK